MAMLKEELGRITTEFLNRRVRVVTLKSVPETNLVGMVVGPFGEGETLDLEYWIAEKLEDEGLAKIGDENSLTIEHIEKIGWMQSVQKNKKLVLLPPNFYQLTKRLVERLSRKASLADLKIYEKTFKVFQEIISMRRSTIVTFVLTGGKPENLAEEEEILYERAAELLQRWRDNLQGEEKV
jgi:hypothetical protein